MMKVLDSPGACFSPHTTNGHRSIFSLWANVEAEYKDEAVAVLEHEISINTTSCVHRALGKPDSCLSRCGRQAW